MRQAKYTRKVCGFTLIELTVVLVIIGILGTLVVTRVIGQSEAARSVKARHDVKQIVNGADLFHVRSGRYPESYEELITGRDDKGRLLCGLRLERDPWKNPYHFELRSGEPVAWSLGADGVEGGEGVDADVIYPDPEDAEGVYSEAR